MRDDELIQAITENSEVMRHYNASLQRVADQLEEHNQVMLDLIKSLDGFRAMWVAARQDYETLYRN
jgi:hypothetical protein